MTSVPCGVRQICSARKQSNIFLLLHNMTVLCFIIQVKQGFWTWEEGKVESEKLGWGTKCSEIQVTELEGTTWNIKWARFKNTGKSLQWEQISCFDMAVSLFQRRLLWIEYNRCVEFQGIQAILQERWLTECQHAFNAAVKISLLIFNTTATTCNVILLLQNTSTKTY